MRDIFVFDRLRSKRLLDLVHDAPLDVAGSDEVHHSEGSVDKDEGMYSIATLIRAFPFQDNVLRHLHQCPDRSKQHEDHCDPSSDHIAAKWEASDGRADVADAAAGFSK